MFPIVDRQQTRRLRKRALENCGVMGADETVSVPFSHIENRAIGFGRLQSMAGPVVLWLNALTTIGQVSGDRL
jgi:hypothetical protein